MTNHEHSTHSNTQSICSYDSKLDGVNNRGVLSIKLITLSGITCKELSSREINHVHKLGKQTKFGAEFSCCRGKAIYVKDNKSVGRNRHTIVSGPE